MITYELENRGKKALYEVLYEKIRSDIIDGRLKAGEKLPSKRAFAAQCGVSVITVENAYAQLCAEGFLTAKARSGFYVSEVFPETGGARHVLPEKKLREDESGKDEGSRAEAASCAGREDVPLFADFTSNAIPPSSFPFSVWSRLMRETLSEDQEKLLMRSPSEGIYELRAAIAEYLRQFRGFDADADRIIIGAGTEYLYGLLIQLLDKDAVIAVEEPGYSKVTRICEANGAAVRHIPVDEQGMDEVQLRKSDATIVHLSPGHHFPTGVVMPIGRRLKLLEWASADPQRCIIEDDYDSEFRMSGRPVPTLAGIDHTDSVIYMNTFSKSLSQTIRISYMVLPRPLMERYRRNLDFYACTVSNFEQYTLAKFISRGYFEKHINRMRNRYRGIRDELLRGITLRGDKDQVREEHAGLHFLLHVKTRQSDDALMRRARENGIRISCLSSSYADRSAAPAHILVMNYSALPKERIDEALTRLYDCLDEKKLDVQNRNI